VERRRQGRGRHQRFIGSRARLNCEDVPVIPARLVRSNLDDPRRIPYLLVWKDENHDGEIREAVRLARFVGTFDDHAGLKRTDESRTILRIVWRMLPRHGGRVLFLLCRYCDKPCRRVYGWEWDGFSGWSNRVRRICWQCRSCARLRYSAEGGYLRVPGSFLSRAFGYLPPDLRKVHVSMFGGHLPRPKSWLPYVFASAEEAAAAGVCEVGC
jgi:hypothetical protein